MPPKNKPSRADYVLDLDLAAQHKAPAQAHLVVMTAGETEARSEPTGKKIKQTIKRLVEKVVEDPNTKGKDADGNDTPGNEIRTQEEVDEEIEVDEMRDVPSAIIYDATVGAVMSNGQLGPINCRSADGPEAAERLLAAALRRLADQIDPQK